MKVSYSASVSVSLDAAKAATLEQHPTANLSGVDTPHALESYLLENGLVVFVDISLDSLYSQIQQRADEVGREVDSQIDEYCPPDDLEKTTFTDDDLDIPCDEQEFPTFERIDPVDFDNVIKSLSANQDSLDSKLQQAQQCISDMKKISDDMNILVENEQLVRQTLVNVEQLHYNLRIMDAYYRTRVDTMDGILKTFDPLLRRLSEIQDVLIPRLSLAPDNQSQIAALVAEANDIRTRIQLAKSNIYSFDNEALQSADQATRSAALQSNITDLDMGQVAAEVLLFSSRCRLNADGPSFLLHIEHSLDDPGNVLSGRDLSFAKSGDNVTIDAFGAAPTGTLYDRLYNVWADPDLFFTRDERGLTDTKEQSDPALKDASAAMDSNYVKNLGEFQEFYANYPNKHKEKTAQVKSQVIEPALDILTEKLKSFATREVSLLLSVGKAFEVLPAQDARLQDIVTVIKNISASYIKRMDDCDDAYNAVKIAHEKVLADIEAKKQELSNVPCALGDKGDMQPKTAPGSDPLKVGNEDPTNPNFTKYCYWLQFAGLATAVGVLPLPGPGGFKYWPIGLTVPSPGGLVKIPLPVIWIPLAVVALPVGVMVIFIAQCGICPSPMIMFVGSEGEKKFIVSLRPTDQFGTGGSAGTIKTIDKGGIATNLKTNSMVNNVKVKVNVTQPDGSISSQLSTPPNFQLSGSNPALDAINEAKSIILKKINKLGQPDVTKLTNLVGNATKQNKLDALTATVLEHVDKLKIPDINIPKDSSKINPKPIPSLATMDKLGKLSQMDLPQVTTPPTMSVKQVFMDAISKTKSGDGTISVPKKGDPQYQKQKDKFKSEVSTISSALISDATKSISPASFGVFAVAGAGVSFSNPYQCGPSAQGISTPPLPPAASIAIGAISAAVGAVLADYLDDQKISLLGPTISKQGIKKLLLDAMASALPDFDIPNPSNLSLSSFSASSAFSLSAMQLPSLPSLTVPIQPNIPISGNLLKDAIKAGVASALQSVDVASMDFSQLSPVDVKQIAVSLVEESFGVLEGTIRPFSDIITKYASASDQSFTELIGMFKPPKDDSVVPVVDKDAKKAADVAVDLMAFIPYPAVAFLPNLFSNLHPILVADDLPPWERLSLSNFLFVAFLDQWCTQGKKGAGLFENPL